MLTYQEIKEIYNRLHRQNDGAINDFELEFVQDVIKTRLPKVFVEIGVASGMSSGFIARFMSAYGGQVLHSIDTDEQYYADKTKRVGYLIPEIYSGSPVRLELHIKKSALDIAEILGGTKYDMAFIDANHAHPWPTIDTMLLLPFAKAGAPLLHHDLSLYKQERWKKGIGPKFLFDQFSESEKHVIHHPTENIGYFTAPLGDYHAFEAKLLTSMKMQWTEKLHPYFADRIGKRLEEHWGKNTLNVFEEAFHQFSILNG